MKAKTEEEGNAGAAETEKPAPVLTGGGLPGAEA